jgi:hypothetical protein
LEKGNRESKSSATKGKFASAGYEYKIDLKAEYKDGRTTLKVAPSASWVESFVGDLGTKGRIDPNKDLKVVIPPMEPVSNKNNGKGSKK